MIPWSPHDRTRGVLHQPQRRGSPAPESDETCLLVETPWDSSDPVARVTMIITLVQMEPGVADTNAYLDQCLLDRILQLTVDQRSDLAEQGLVDFEFVGHVDHLPANISRRLLPHKLNTHFLARSLLPSA